MIVAVDAARITGWDTFHEVFAETFGFPDFYGRNMNAWVDCMTDLDEPGTGMTRVHVIPGEVLTVHLSDVEAVARIPPEILQGLLECAAFVNWRRIDMGQPPVLAVSLFDRR